MLTLMLVLLVGAAFLLTCTYKFYTQIAQSSTVHFFKVCWLKYENCIALKFVSLEFLMWCAAFFLY